MKKICFLLLILFCGISVYAQKIPISINGNYRTETKDWGVGTQIMIPVYKNFMVAPSLNYFFEKKHEFYAFSIKTRTLNYGVDFHYAFHLMNTKSFISPFVGVEGMTSWVKIKSGGKQNFKGDIDDADVLANVGIAGKWFMSDNFFINTQVKYSVIFASDDNPFVFTAGLGYAF